MDVLKMMRTNFYAFLGSFFNQALQTKQPTLVTNYTFPNVVSHLVKEMVTTATPVAAFSVPRPSAREAQ
jgi:hypothetical protein